VILYLFPFQQSDGGEDDRPNDSIFSPTYHHHKDSGLNNLSTGIYSFNTFITFSF
jgi:CTD small phosphatase-like protein 2